MGLIVDSFAGGGGASLGIAWALGRAPDIAINHNTEAIAMHEANHPSTRHVLEDVWRADLRSLVGGHPVELLWASPDCRHFSRAKGGQPVSKSVRSLAWVVCRWAEQVRPAVICLENVREFADWGPLVPRHECRSCGWRGTEGQAMLHRRRRRCPRCESLRLAETPDLVPDPDRRGLTFRRWVGRLRNLGYQVEWRSLDAADYGAPTHRRRLFLVARCDGAPICWPEPTHAAPEKIERGGLFPDDRLPHRTAAECIDWSIECPSIFARPRPLAEKTMRRIAEGVRRYVLEAAEPFIVQLAHGEGKAGRWGSGSRQLDEPLGTVHAGGGNHALVVPTFVGAGGPDYAAKPRRADRPLGALTANPRTALVAATLTSYYGKKSPGDVRATDLGEPVPVVPTENRHAVVAAFLAKHFGGMVGVDVDTPLPTTTARGTQNQLVAANLVHFNHGEKTWNGVDEPLRTLTTGNHAALVYSFLVRYFGTAIGQHLTEPLYTITGKDRFGLVMVEVDGEPHVIVDIGMRMLTPRELARAQGFPDTYVLTGTKTNQVARIGNSVCPPVVQAIVTANLGAEVLS